MRGRWLFRFKVFIDQSWQAKFKGGQEPIMTANNPSGPKLYTGTACEAVAIMHKSAKMMFMAAPHDRSVVYSDLESKVEK